MKIVLFRRHWNEHFDREFTSVWKPNHRMPRSFKEKKSYKKCTYQFWKKKTFGVDISNLYLETEEIQIHPLLSD